MPSSIRRRDRRWMLSAVGYGGSATVPLGEGSHGSGLARRLSTPVVADAPLADPDKRAFIGTGGLLIAINPDADAAAVFRSRAAIDMSLDCGDRLGRIEQSCINDQVRFGPRFVLMGLN